MEDFIDYFIQVWGTTAGIMFILAGFKGIVEGTYVNDGLEVLLWGVVFTTVSVNWDKIMGGLK